MKKTNAMRILDQAKIPYTTEEYDDDGEHVLERGAAERHGGERRGGHRGLPEEKQDTLRQGEADRVLPRDRARAGGGAADALRAGTQDHHHPQNLRRAGLHHAGGGGRPLPDEQGRDREQDRDLYRWARGGRAGVPLHHHGRVQRHRAGHAAGAGDAGAVRHER